MHRPHPRSQASSTVVTTAAFLLSLALPAGAAAETDVTSVQASIDAWRSDREAVILEDFVELLSIPNVATSLPDMERNAEHIVGLLGKRGFTTQVLRAGGAPYVYAELAVPGAVETVLIYAHFDGQPVQAENWAYPPFSPTLLDGPLKAGGEPVDIDAFEGRFDPEWRLYARSAGDDKMPIVALVHALDALAANGIALSVNVKLLLDGEEEQGSPTIGRIIEEHEDLLEADLLLFCDGPMHPSRRTQLVFGVRGDVTVDITTFGATRPLHSGHYGNWAPNPTMQLAYLLTSLRDPAGRILVDGYYDDVVPLGELEREAIADMPDTTESLKDELSVHTPEGGGERLEVLITQPALNVRGIQAGGVGKKGRNIIVSSATASLDLRLVPDQTPARVRELLEAHVVEEGFHVVHEEPTPDTLREHAKVALLEWESGYPALRTPLDEPMALRLTRLMRRIAPDLIVTPSMGGSLPLHEFGSRLSAPIVILPLANHDDNQHAENENIRLQNLWGAMRIYGAVLAVFGDRQGSTPAVSTVPASSAFTPANVAARFAEARSVCTADDGNLWGISLCGPIMFVDPASHRIFTNQPDTEGRLTQVAPGVYAGELPPGQPVANTATEWAGVRWTQMVWPLSANAAVRRTLMAHEAFHRAQPEVVPIRRVGDNAQLDSLHGRYTMQLEWRALDAALSANTNEEARQRIADALLFRAARYQRFPDAQEAEVALERNEGLAEYTGVMIGNATAGQRLAMAHRDLTRLADDPSFVRSFAYATGPAYGLLLDRFAPDWRRQITGSTRGLAALLAAALHLDLAHMPVDTLAERAGSYDGPALLTAETARMQRRDREAARYRSLLIDGPVLTLPLDDLQMQFDPRTLLPLGDAGTVYPFIRVSDDWGTLDVTGGALMAPDWKQLAVAAPETEAGSGAFDGNGWTLHLAPGWQIVPAARPGDFTLHRATQEK